MRVTCGAIAAPTVSSGPLLFSDDYIEVPGDVAGVGMIYQRGAELMHCIAARVAVNVPRGTGDSFQMISAKS